MLHRIRATLHIAEKCAYYSRVKKTGRTSRDVTNAYYIGLLRTKHSLKTDFQFKTQFIIRFNSKNKVTLGLLIAFYEVLLHQQ